MDLWNGCKQAKPADSGRGGRDFGGREACAMIDLALVGVTSLGVENRLRTCTLARSANAS